MNKQTRTRNTLILAGLLVVLAIAASVAVRLAQKSTEPVYSGPVESITTGLTGEYGSLVLLAQEQGFFAEYSLDVTIKDYASGAPLMADLLAGKLDSGIASDFAGVRNSFMGEDLRIVASMVKSKVFFLVARKDHAITELKDVKGKQIGITKGTAGEFYLGQFLTLNGLRLTDVTIVDKPPADLAAAVAAGTLDAAVLFEPYAYQTSNRLAGNVARWSVQSLQPVHGLLYVNGKFVREHPAALQRYMQAIAKTETYLETHNGEAKAFIARRLQYDQAYIDYIWPELTLEASLDQDLLLTMEDQARWAIENKLTAAAKVPDYLQVMYFAPMLTAKPDSVTIIR